MVFFHTDKLYLNTFKLLLCYSSCLNSIFEIKNSLNKHFGITTDIVKTNKNKRTCIIESNDFQRRNEIEYKIHIKTIERNKNLTTKNEE